MRISDWSSDVCSSDLQQRYGSPGCARTSRSSTWTRAARAEMAATSVRATRLCCFPADQTAPPPMHATSPTRQNTLLYEWLAAANETATHENPELPTPDILRQNLAEMTDTFVTNSPPLPWVRDLMVPDADHPVPVRLYDPAPEQCKPVCLYFHGGGHMAGGIAVYAAICRKIPSEAP